MTALPACRLCGDPRTALYLEDGQRQYFRCAVCNLVFMHPQQRLAPAAERAHYDTHENDVADPRYRAFLLPLYAAVRDRVSPPASGLDFGCGPGPALAQMFRETGYMMALYDKFYSASPAVLQQRYYFVTCSEVVEHLEDPGDTLAMLVSLLVPGGWLAIMTRMLTPQTDFAGWYYRRDPTHIAFYSHASWQWLATRHRLHVQFAGADIALLGK